MLLAIFFRMVVLPALGGETIMPRWPLPIGAMMSRRRMVISLPSVSIRSRLMRVDRGHFLEDHPVAQRFGISQIDRLDF